MYAIVITSVLLLVVVYFATTLFSVIKYLSYNNDNKVSIGSKWFVGLFIINITLIIFTCLFFYYKTETEGDKGATGLVGFDGLIGDIFQIFIYLSTQVFHNHNINHLHLFS